MVMSLCKAVLRYGQKGAAEALRYERDRDQDRHEKGPGKNEIRKRI